MRYFDLHCDTVGECCRLGKSLVENDLHISLERQGIPESYTQVFAIWIPDTLRGTDAVDYFEKVYAYYCRELQKNEAFIVPYENSTPADTRCRAVLSVEGGAALGGSLHGLHRLHACGVAMMTLTWNAANEIASGAAEDEGGLTSFGREVVREMEELSMTVDVSHLNRKSFFDVADFALKPFVASHSNADLAATPSGHRRNLTDSQIAAIVSAGGLIGLNFFTEFLGKEPEKCGFQAIEQQLSYFLSHGARTALAFGSDFDGCTVHNELSGIEKLPKLYRYLLSRGYDEALLECVFYGNAERFFSVK